MEQSQNKTGPAETRKLAHHMRLPGFVPDEPIGLGDVIKRITYAVGIKPCSGCERRAERLNQWMVFSK
ncbi:MAG: hypothetical protein WBW33_28780 [Bryobacteraceae bacterium]